MTQSLLQPQILIDPDLWSETRAGARAGRGFRYQDAVAAWLTCMAYPANSLWTRVIPEGVDDITLHGDQIEYRVQVKARHDPRKTFGQAEIAGYLMKSASTLPTGWPKGPAVRLALVLERPAEGLLATGWSQTLAESAQDLCSLSKHLEREFGDESTQLIRELLKHTHLVVEAEPITEGCLALETASALPPALIRLAVQKICESVGGAADENFKAPAHRPASLGRTNVQQVLDYVFGVTNPRDYLDLTHGLAEAAEFTACIPSKSFYQGVNVVPAHVGAGLIFSRPELMVEVLSGLESKRYALIAGPSGSGKSAAAWLSAYHTRHFVRWYRVRSLRSDDVSRLVQMARILEASISRPVGFVVDDVGRQETAGWDALIREVEAFPGILAIATSREEDLFLLETAARTPVARPALDESLARRIWDALQRADEVQFSHWQEPYDLSRGLLLEYTHLLTSGQRLEATIHEQVRRRLEEGRGDELSILRVVSFASSVGAAVDSDRLRACTTQDEFQFARALQRLIQEHAVRTRDDGALIGLHEIRSKALDEAVLQLLGDRRKKAIQLGIQCSTSNSLSGLIVRTLRRWPEEEPTILEALLQRLATEAADCWASVAHGLGIATAERVAEKWLEISRLNKIEDRLTGTAFGIALTKSDLSSIPAFARVSAAQEAFENTKIRDLRQYLLPAHRAWKPSELTIQEAILLNASMLAIVGTVESPKAYLIPDASEEDTSFELIIELLRILHDLEPMAASEYVEKLGGTGVLLERVYREMPWITKPELVEHESKPAVSSHFFFVNQDAQPDLNGSVVKLCEWMLAVAPRVEIAIADVLCSDGTPFGFNGKQFHSKRLSRSAIPPAARITWNRTQIRSAQRLVAATFETQRTGAIAMILTDLDELLREAADFYCRGERPTERWKELFAARQWLTSFIQPPSIEDRIEGVGATDQALGTDAPYSLVQGILELIGNLVDTAENRPSLWSYRAAKLAEKAEQLRRPELWRMTSTPPIDALLRIRDSLREIWTSLGDIAITPNRHERLKVELSSTSRRHSALTKAAKRAKERAREFGQSICTSLEHALAEQGIDVEATWRDYANELWPNHQYIALAKGMNLTQWTLSLDKFSAAISQLNPTYPVSYGALINQKVTPIGFKYALVPIADDHFSTTWADHLSYPMLKDRAYDLFCSATDALYTISAVFGSVTAELRPAEDLLYQQMTERLLTSTEGLADLVETQEGAGLSLALDVLNALIERVRSEISGDLPGEFASVFAASLQGQWDPVIGDILVTKHQLLEDAAARQKSH